MSPHGAETLQCKVRGDMADRTRLALPSPTASREERMTRLKFELREHIRFNYPHLPALSSSIKTTRGIKTTPSDTVTPMTPNDTVLSAALRVLGKHPRALVHTPRSTHTYVLQLPGGLRYPLDGLAPDGRVAKPG